MKSLHVVRSGRNLRRVEPLLQTFRDVAAEVDVKAQVALAWLTSQFNVAAADIELKADSRHALTEAARAFRPVSTGRFLVDMVREKLRRR